MVPITRWRHPDRRHRSILTRKRLMTMAIHGSGLYRGLDRLCRPTRHIVVTRHRVMAPVSRPIRLALVSDIHVVRPGPREERLIELLEGERPDAIAMNGDFAAL